MRVTRISSETESVAKVFYVFNHCPKRLWLKSFSVEQVRRRHQWCRRAKVDNGTSYPLAVSLSIEPTEFINKNDSTIGGKRI